MQTPSSQFTRWARVCSAFAMASLVFVLLGLAGCGPSGSTSTSEQPCIPLASVTNPSSSGDALSHTDGASSSSASSLSASLSSRQALSPSVPHKQYQLGFWEQGIIAVAVVADTSGDLPAASAVQHAVQNQLDLSSLKDHTVTTELPAHLPSLIHATNSTVETVILQLQSGSGPDTDDDDLKQAIDVINANLTSPCKAVKAAIAGASPDWIMEGGSAGDFVGGHPDDPPSLLTSATANSAQAGGSKDVYVLDTADPLALMGSPGQHTASTSPQPVASTLCLSPPSSPACKMVHVLSASVDEMDALLPDETAYTKWYGNDKSFREHGLFVSAIIHYVAPGAKVHLRRVLNDQGVGDMATLLYALTQVPQGSIVNLSLAIQPPPSCLLAIWGGQDANSVGSTPTTADYSPYTKADGSIDPSQCKNTLATQSPELYKSRLLLPLGSTIRDMTLHDLTVVAAAGNDSTSGAHLGPDLPAAICGVTAVAAIDSTTGGLATFSNDPTGQQCLDFPTSLAGLKSQAPTTAVTGSTGPGVKICSLYAAPTSVSGAATWSGTSFATAYVSGQQAGGSNTTTQPCHLNPSA
jgi:Subtilase family